MYATRSLSRSATRSLVAGAALVALSTGLTACGEDAASQDATTPAAGEPVEIADVGTVEVDDALAEALPAEVSDAKEVTVATNAPYAPFIDFVEEGNTEDFTGLDHDLVVAIAARLGIAAEFQQQPFDGLVPGLQAGKYDAIVGGITDNFERQRPRPSSTTARRAPASPSLRATPTASARSRTSAATASRPRRRRSRSACSRTSAQRSAAATTSKSPSTPRTPTPCRPSSPARPTRSPRRGSTCWRTPRS